MHVIHTQTGHAHYMTARQLIGAWCSTLRGPAGILQLMFAAHESTSWMGTLLTGVEFKLKFQGSQQPGIAIIHHSPGAFTRPYIFSAGLDRAIFDQPDQPDRSWFGSYRSKTFIATCREPLLVFCPGGRTVHVTTVTGLGYQFRAVHQLLNVERSTHRQLQPSSSWGL